MLLLRTSEILNNQCLKRNYNILLVFNYAYLYLVLAIVTVLCIPPKMHLDQSALPTFVSIKTAMGCIGAVTSLQPHLTATERG